VFFDDTPHFQRHGKVFYACWSNHVRALFVRCVSFCDAEHCSGHYSARHDRKVAPILSAGDQKMRQIRKKATTKHGRMVRRANCRILGKP